MNFDKIPVYPRKKLLPEGEASEVTERKYKAMISLLEGEFADISPKERPTVLDFQGLHPNSTEQDLFKWVELELGVKAEVLASPQNKETIETYGKINDAYQKAKIFMQETLKYSEKDLPSSPKEINSKKDLLGFLNKTILLNNKISPDGMKNCRLAKAVIVAYETIKHDAELLAESTEDFENSLVAPAAKGTPLAFLKDTEQGKKFYTSKEGKVGHITSRGKDIDKAMLRFITRAESNAKTALKDGIASRITIEKKYAPDLLPQLCKWLLKDMNVDRIKIENQSFLDQKQMKQLKNALQNKALQDNFSENQYRLKESEADSTSMGGFKAIKIIGRLDSSEKDTLSSTKFSISSISPHARQFEIQIVDPANENEKGERNHSIYDVAKLVSARTRLDGGCPEHIFNEFVKDAAEKSGMSEETIIGYLTQQTKTGKTPAIVKTYRKNNEGVNVGRPLYVARSVYTRWDEFGWIDNSLVSEIDLTKIK